MALTKITRAILDTGVSDNSDATAITIDSSERVGIGTTSPGKNLEVNDSATPTIRFARSNSFYWDVGHTSSQFQFNSQTGGTIMQLNYDGNVGIGTTSPVATLQVKTQADGNLAFQNSTSVTGGVKLNCFNDAANASSPFEIDGSSLQFNIASTIKARIDSDGLKFGSDTAAANALDDYEEGIHVATIACGTSGTVTLNGAYSDLSYTKIGRLVTVTGFLIVSSVSSPVGYYTISLPFTAANLTDRAGDATVNIKHHYGNNAKPSDIVAFLPQNSSIFYVYRGDVGVTRSSTAAEELRASTQIMFTVTYNAA